MEANNKEYIVCDGLVKIYKTKDLEVLALQGLDLTIQKGELIGIIGKSGSGKSTLMNMIGGLEGPSAGRILVGGEALHEMPPGKMCEYRKKTVGFVWQKSARNLFPFLTSIENVEASMQFTRLSRKEKRKRSEYLLSLVGMGHKKNAFPSQMSGGEQQRIAIAVALANEPEILLADEPTGAVDSKTSQQIQDLFRKLNQELGLTIIIVTHDLKLAEHVDRVVMISDGKISVEKKGAGEEQLVLDKARRLQLSEEILKKAGISSNKVQVKVEEGKVIISA